MLRIRRHRGTHENEKLDANRIPEPLQPCMTGAEMVLNSGNNLLGLVIKRPRFEKDATNDNVLH